MKIPERYSDAIKDLWHEVFEYFDDEPDLKTETCGRLAQAAADAVERELGLLYADYTLDGEPIPDIYQWFTDNDIEGPERRAVNAMVPGDTMNFGGGAAPVRVLAHI